MAAEKTRDEICEFIGADTLDFLQVENLTKTLGSEEFCLGCFNGVYPLSTVANM